MRMPQYGEVRPPARLAEAVECFWWMRQEGDSAIVHRVVPDGCADILFEQSPRGATLQAVGAMTRFVDFEMPARGLSVGVRFRPGMWTAQIGTLGDRITDRLIPLEELWGARAIRLRDRMANATCPGECASLLAECVCEIRPRSAVQRAVGVMEACAGRVSLDDVARQAGLSVRQFRRVCMEQTGLSPKLLARVLRFRRALSHVAAQMGEHAGLAAECGYSDQSHFIAEFRRFAGSTPLAHATSCA